MPNHVYHIMSVNGTDAEVKKFFDNHITAKGDDGEDYFDFDTIIPFPAELVGTTSPNSPPRVNGKEVSPNSAQYKAWKKNSERLIEVFGYDNWYDWKVANQGTKWGAYDYAPDTLRENTFSFQTAWSTPDPIFEKMAELYPTLWFEIDVVEEGGYFSGNITIENGEVEEMLNNDEEQWKQFASDMMGWNFDDDEDEERQDVIDMIDYAKDKLDKPDTIINELISFTKENIDDFIKFSKN